MLFHLGALWRLNELGYLPKLARISSVSGGSITAGVLGMNWKELRFDPKGVSLSFTEVVVTPVHRLASVTIDQWAIIGGIVTPGATQPGDREIDCGLRHHADPPVGHVRLRKPPHKGCGGLLIRDPHPPPPFVLDIAASPIVESLAPEDPVLRTRRLLPIVLVVAGVALVATGYAQPVSDHLKCYKAKDSQRKQTYTADLTGLTAEAGCTIASGLSSFLDSISVEQDSGVEPCPQGQKCEWRVACRRVSARRSRRRGRRRAGVTLNGFTRPSGNVGSVVAAHAREGAAQVWCALGPSDDPFAMRLLICH